MQQSTGFCACPLRMACMLGERCCIHKCSGALLEVMQIEIADAGSGDASYT